MDALQNPLLYADLKKILQSKKISKIFNLSNANIEKKIIQYIFFRFETQLSMFEYLI